VTKTVPGQRSTNKSSYRQSPRKSRRSRTESAYHLLGGQALPATEFRVLPDDLAGRARDRKVRLLLWGAVAALIGTAALGIVGVRSMSREMESVLVWTAGAITAGVVIGAYYLAYRHGLNKIRSSLVFLLTDEELLRRRPGWPDVRIELCEIGRLHEHRGWFVVESRVPGRRIVIPNDVQGYAGLKRELTKYDPGTEKPKGL
jgi:hypothetical protein